MKQLSRSKGFIVSATVFALVIIVTIAGCSNPTSTNGSSSKVTARNFLVVIKQWEAKQILQQIYKMEQAYREKHGLYWPNGLTACDFALSTIGITIPSFAKYTYCIHAGLWGFDFIATASSTVLDDDATIDSWTINDLG